MRLRHDVLFQVREAAIVTCRPEVLPVLLAMHAIDMFALCTREVAIDEHEAMGGDANLIALAGGGGRLLARLGSGSGCGVKELGFVEVS